jgi:hypothetical protein
MPALNNFKNPAADYVGSSGISLVNTSYTKVGRDVPVRRMPTSLRSLVVSFLYRLGLQ